MEFIIRTQYSPHFRYVSNPGSRIHIQYGGHYDEKGRVVLEEIGKINTYAEIQSHKDSVDIHVLMRQFFNGDVEALSRRQGFYADVTEMPKTMAEALNMMVDRERDFYSLPVEVRQKFNNSFSEFLAASGSPDFAEKLGFAKSTAIPTDSAPVEPKKEGADE